MAKDTKKLTEKITKFKADLIKKAKKKGIYENFGQDEAHELAQEFGITSEVVEFRDWALNFDLEQLKAS